MPKSPTSWGDVAEWYDRMLGEGDTYQAKVVLPNLTRLLALRKGEKLLEIACGQGYFCRAFAAQGAEVTGADIAPELVALAEKRSAGEKVRPRYLVAPSHDVSPVAAGSMDKAVIILALQNIDDVRGTLQECARVLAMKGSLHLVLNHPAFRVPKGSSWEWDKAGKQYRRVDRYLTEAKEKIKMRPGADPTAETVSFHRPLQYFVKALARQGFAVTGLEEWTSHKKSDSGPRAKEENRARNEIPLFMYVEAKKL